VCTAVREPENEDVCVGGTELQGQKHLHVLSICIMLRASAVHKLSCEDEF